MEAISETGLATQTIDKQKKFFKIRNQILWGLVLFVLAIASGFMGISDGDAPDEQALVFMRIGSTIGSVLVTSILFLLSIGVSYAVFRLFKRNRIAGLVPIVTVVVLLVAGHSAVIAKGFTQPDINTPKIVSVVEAEMIAEHEMLGKEFLLATRKARKESVFMRLPTATEQDLRDTKSDVDQVIATGNKYLQFISTMEQRLEKDLIEAKVDIRHGAVTDARAEIHDYLSGPSVKRDKQAIPLTIQSMEQTNSALQMLIDDWGNWKISFPDGVEFEDKNDTDTYRSIMNDMLRTANELQAANAGSG